MRDFEQLLEECNGPLERFVYFRMSGHEADAEDILQEIKLTAYLRFHSLRDRERFKPWLIQIARNKCRDYYRRHQGDGDVPLETVENYLTASRYGLLETVRDTLDAMPERDRQLLQMTYYEELSQAEIASRLNIPVGTVKSRMYTAKRNFKAAYPFPPNLKGDFTMKQLPNIMPEYTITPSDQAPFPVKWEELMGWFIVPRLGEKLQWAMYDGKTRQRSQYAELEVIGKSRIHGIEGVEIRALEYNPVPSEQLNAQDPVERTLVVQLTDTHCRILSESHVKDGIRDVYTFLDGDDFLENWGFGPDNCGNETNLWARGTIHREGDTITADGMAWPMDVVGRYTVTIGGKSYDTVCVMDVECYENAVVSETYLDCNGKTVLWRRFNWDDWAMKHFKSPWTERLPDNQRLTINGQTYVHWYDCITDYIL